MAFSIDGGTGAGSKKGSSGLGSSLNKPWQIGGFTPPPWENKPRPNYPSSDSPMLSQNTPSSSTSNTVSSGSGGGGYYVQPQPDPYEAYKKAMEEIEAKQRAAREQAYQAAAQQQKNDLAYSTNQVNDATDKALQQAYINKMMTLRNLPQTMAAQGLTGGASESTMAGLYNNYSDARNDLEGERVSQIGALQQAYNNNMAQLESQRASGEAASLSELTPYLMNLVANNAPSTVSVQQGGGTSGGRMVWDENLQQWVWQSA